jgi:hypothetical protein
MDAQPGGQTKRQRLQEAAREQATAKRRDDGVSAVAELHGGVDNPRERVGDAGMAAKLAAIMAGKAPDEGQAQAQPEPTTQGEGQEQGEGEGEGEGEGQAQGEGEGEGEGQEQKPSTLADVAAALGLTTAELNAAVVQVGSESMTLGELKNKLPELVKVEARAVQLAEARETFELERIDAHRRILAIVDAFPAGSVPKAVSERLEAQHAETLARESSLLRTARPEWATPAYAAEHKAKMTALAARYGVGAAEVGAIADHRMILMLQDFANLKHKHDAAAAAAKRIPAPGDRRMSAETQAQPSASNQRRAGQGNKQALTARLKSIMDRVK